MAGRLQMLQTVGPPAAAPLLLPPTQQHVRRCPSVAAAAPPQALPPMLLLLPPPACCSSPASERSARRARRALLAPCRALPVEEQQQQAEEQQNSPVAAALAAALAAEGQAAPAQEPAPQQQQESTHGSSAHEHQATQPSASPAAGQITDQPSTDAPRRPPPQQQRTFATGTQRRQQRQQDQQLQQGKGNGTQQEGQGKQQETRFRSIYYWPATRHAKQRPPFQEAYPPDGLSYNINSFLGPMDTHKGKLYVPPEQYKQFLTEYHAAFHAGYQLFLSERYGSQPFRYFLELDFPWGLPQHLVQHAVDRLFPSLTDVVRAAYQVQAPTLRTLVSMRTPYKVHVNWPTLVTTELQAMMCRDQIIEHARKLFSGGTEDSSSSSSDGDDATRALDREVAAVMDWESIIDFPHGSFRMLGSRKSKLLTVNKEPSWVVDKAYYPVRYTRDAGWVTMPITLDRICESSIIPTPEQRQRFEQSAAYLRFIYADASAYEQRMRDKIQQRLEAQEQALRQLAASQGAAPSSTSSAQPGAEGDASAAAAGVGATPAEEQENLRQRRKMESELSKLQSLSAARDRERRHVELRALAEGKGKAGQPYLTLLGQLDRVETEQRTTMSRLSLLQRQLQLGERTRGAAPAEAKGASAAAGPAPEAAGSQQQQEEEEVQRMKAHVGGLQRLVSSLRGQLRQAAATLLGEDPAAEPPRKPQQKRASAAPRAPAVPRTAEEEALHEALAEARHRMKQAQSPLTSLQQLVAKVRASGREPHADDERLVGELREQLRVRTKEVADLQNRIKQVRAAYDAAHGASGAGEGEGNGAAEGAAQAQAAEGAAQAQAAETPAA